MSEITDRNPKGPQDPPPAPRTREITRADIPTIAEALASYGLWRAANGLPAETAWTERTRAGLIAAGLAKPKP